MGDPSTVACPRCGEEAPADDPYCYNCHCLLTKYAGNRDGFKPGLPPSPPETLSADRSEHPLKPPPAVDAADLRCKACGASLKPTRVGELAVCPYCKTSQVVEAGPRGLGPQPLSESSLGALETYGDDLEPAYSRRKRPRQIGFGWAVIYSVVFIVIGLICLSLSSQQFCSSNTNETEICKTAFQTPLLTLGLLFIMVGIVLAIFVYFRYLSPAAS